MSESARHVVIGAGIVGLATAYELIRQDAAASVTVVDKEDHVGAHQSGHNSGVIHAGVYYAPGSLKAKLCRAGAQSMMDFCRAHGIPTRVCGKLIVATDEAELPRLHALHERAMANQLPVTLLDPARAKEYEPNAACVGALHVASTAIVDFGAVTRRLAQLISEAGGRIQLATKVVGIHKGAGGRLTIETTRGVVPADHMINCAGLHCDRVAQLAGVKPPARIVAFRGEYFELRPDRRDLVRGLLYPVPDPRFPFLGVHLTRMIDGSVHAGPNAVLALAREGYTWRRFNPRDLAETAAYPGTWRLARRHLRTGLAEVRRSLSAQAFARSLARLVPQLTRADLVRAGAGVRAQAVARDGRLVDDFLIVNTPGQTHVLNAPSPAATSSLEIAKHIVSQLTR